LGFGEDFPLPGLPRTDPLMLVEASLRARRFGSIRTRMFGLAILSAITCTAEAPQPTDTAEQAVINPPLPSNLNLVLNAKTTVTIGAFTQVNADVASAGLNGSVLFDVSSSQGFGFPVFNVLANTVTVNTGASAGHVFGNDITINGSVFQESLGLDPTALPQVPAVTAATPGTTNVSINQNQARQLCPGQYGAISLGVNAVLNLNGGVYQVTRLTLADGARLEPSEPVVILVSGGMTTGIGSVIRPSSQSINPMGAAEFRIETGGAVTLGDSNQIRAHLLVTGKFTTGKSLNLTGAAWAKTINIGTNGFIGTDGVFSAHARAVPPPCNDNNACTVDSCVGGGRTAAFCRNALAPANTLCEDGNTCNGVETCDGAGTCQPGENAEQGTSCADNTLCNGDEACDGVGACQAGEPPVVSDGNQCTADACDPETGVSHVPVPDGTRCNGIGSCRVGVCSVQGAVFSEDFVAFQSAPAQCDSWNDFLDNRLSDTSFNRITVSGTFDSTGVTCDDPGLATLLCQSLHHRRFASTSCNGHQWNVGDCGGTLGSLAIAVDNSVCSCTFDFGFEHMIRPCLGFNWGGVGSPTCNAPSQNMTVVCQ
jgi:hypothetical protein